MLQPNEPPIQGTAAIFKEKAKHSNFLDGHNLDQLSFPHPGSK